MNAVVLPESANAMSFLGFSAAAVAYAAVSLLMLTSWRRGPLGAWLIAACVLTAAWSAAAAFQAISPGDADMLVPPLELARSAGWIAFLVAILIPTWENGSAARLRVIVPAAVSALCVSIALIDIFGHGWLGVTIGEITVDI